MMKRFVFMILVGCSICGLVFGQAADGEAKKPVGPKLWLESAAIDLGVIAVGEQEIKGVIPYMNDGDETLEVTNIKGSCDCFAGFEGEKVLAPGEGGELIIKFDKSKIESGPVKRMVRFETNDPANKQVRVNFSFEIERTDSEGELKGELKVRGTFFASRPLKSAIIRPDIHRD